MITFITVDVPATDSPKADTSKENEASSRQSNLLLNSTYYSLSAPAVASSPAQALTYVSCPSIPLIPDPFSPQIVSSTEVGGSSDAINSATSTTVANADRVAAVMTAV